MPAARPISRIACRIASDRVKPGYLAASARTAASTIARSLPRRQMVRRRRGLGGLGDVTLAPPSVHAKLGAFLLSGKPPPVQSVVASGAKVEVIWVDALLVVALVTDHQSVWLLSVVQVPRNTMGCRHDANVRSATVSRRPNTPCPVPASVWSILVDEAPEALDLLVFSQVSLAFHFHAPIGTPPRVAFSMASRLADRGATAPVAHRETT